MRFILIAFALLTPGVANSDFLPVIMVESITIRAPDTYAALVAEANTVMRERHAAPLYLRAYVAPTITGADFQGFALSPSASLTSLMAARTAFTADPSLADLREKLQALTLSGESTYLKAIRFDGTYTPGWLCNTLVKTTDETALLQRVQALVEQLSQPDTEPVFINVFRVIAGPGPSSHLVSINAPSSADLAIKLDRALAPLDTLTDSSVRLISRTFYRELIP
jgi:hypothetical protein